MIERVLRSKLRRRGMVHRVCCLLAMVEVDANDPAFRQPTKFVGPFYREEEVEALARERGWAMKEDKGRGWRRVVPSPEPKSIIQRQEILTLLEAGTVVISGGGGGIPVARSSNGELVGAEGVVDKDLASAVMALALGAPELIILTGVDRVQIGYGTPQARALNIVSVDEARAYMAQGHFPAGSMGPKMEAACRFVEGGGSRTLITNVFTLKEALAGTTGTWVTA
jgi:carbamate kinase